MSESCRGAGTLETSDRSGPECRERFGDAVNSPSPQDLSVLIGGEQDAPVVSEPEAAAFKFLRFDSICEEFSTRDHPFMCV